jgi:hypothetical protein
MKIVYWFYGKIVYTFCGNIVYAFYGKNTDYVFENETT